MHCLSHLACKGSEEMRFVLHKFKEALAADLKIHLKKLDNNGFDFFLYFVK